MKLLYNTFSSSLTFLQKYLNSSTSQINIFLLCYFPTYKFCFSLQFFTATIFLTKKRKSSKRCHFNSDRWGRPRTLSRSKIFCPEFFRKTSTARTTSRTPPSLPATWTGSAGGPDSSPSKPEEKTMRIIY